MKHQLLTFLLISYSVLTFAQDITTTSTISTDTKTEKKELKWETDFETAKKLAKKENKPLLVFFTGSDWCGPCRLLHTHFFETEKFIELATKELILYKADFPRRTDLVTPEQKTVNYRIKSKYAIRGYPTVIMLNSNGEEIGRRSGFSYDHDTQYHYALVQDAIDKNN